MCFVSGLEKVQVLLADCTTPSVFATPAECKRLTTVVIRLFAKCDKTMIACKYCKQHISFLCFIHLLERGLRKRSHLLSDGNVQRFWAQFSLTIWLRAMCESIGRSVFFVVTSVWGRNCRKPITREEGLALLKLNLRLLFCSLACVRSSWLPPVDCISKNTKQSMPQTRAKSFDNKKKTVSCVWSDYHRLILLWKICSVFTVKLCHNKFKLLIQAFWPTFCLFLFSFTGHLQLLCSWRYRVLNLPSGNSSHSTVASWRAPSPTIHSTKRPSTLPHNSVLSRISLW